MIRQTRADDWRLVREIRLRALADAPHAFLDTVEVARDLPERHWRGRAEPSDTQACFLLEEGGLVSCFVADDPANVFLVAMWVSPDLRGSGAARGLVEHVVDWARASGAERVCLSVEGGNERATRLYERCGFVETGEPPRFPYVPNEGNRFYVLEL